MSSTIHNERDGIVMEINTEDQLHAQQKQPLEQIADLHNGYNAPSACHLNYCGFESCYPGYSFGPHTRTSYLIHIVLSGKGTYQVGKHTYTISAGQVFLIYPNDITIYCADSEFPWTYGWVGFSGFASEEHLTQSGFSRKNHVISVSDVETLGQCIRNMVEKSQITYAHELYRTSELLKFFALLIENRKGRVPIPQFYSRATYAKVAKTYIDNHYMPPLRIAKIAEQIGIDRSYLSKSFQEEFHISPQEYLMQIRVKQAKQLLLKSKESIAAVAQKVGYTDALTFSKDFRRCTSLSPSAFRSIAHRHAEQDQSTEASAEFREPSYAQLVARYMEDHFHERLQIREIAQHIGVDRHYLSKCFQSEYGIPPQEFLIRLRMRHAQSLLRGTSLPLSVIAIQVGYLNQQSFSKEFHHRFGISPSAYRHQSGKETEGSKDEFPI